ncbi:MAG TPA: M50 family metallopeptidase [Candidatus Limnocylindrales bacterium]|nr:M50 family metallopeptidase [Candidatus Limnocylindrales bacterium]
MAVTESIWEALGGRAPGRPIGPADPDLFAAVVERINPARARPRLRAGIEEASLVALRGSPYVMFRSPDQSAAYLRLEPAEAALARRMDGSRTVAALVGEFARLSGELAPARVVRIVADLAANRMLDDLPLDVFEPVRRVRRESWPRRARRTLADVFRGRRYAVFGVDPLVGLLYRAGGRVFFTRVGAVVVGVVAVAGAIAFGARWVGGSQSVFLVSDSVVAGSVLLLALNVVCLLAHEVGHALAAKHAGRRVPSAGFLLYFGIPSAFVDTSDVWMAGRRARLVTSAAGPVAALTLAGALNLAAIAVPELAPAAFKLGFLWYLNVVFNLNPLLALDGYYLLMDWLELPRLRSRGLALTIARLKHRRFGWAGLAGEDRFYAMYGTAALLWLVLTLGLGVRLWKDRVDGVGAALWHEGIGGQAGLLLIVALILAPLVGTLVGRVGAAIGAWRRARAEAGPGADLDRRIAILRRSALGTVALPALTELARSGSWVRVRDGATVDAGPLVIASGVLDGRQPTDPPGVVRRRAFPGDIVGGADDETTWRGFDARLLRLPSGVDPRAAQETADPERALVAAAGAVAAPRESALRSGLHGDVETSPALTDPVRTDDPASEEAERRLDRRTRRWLLVLALAALLSLLAALPPGAAWSEVPTDRVLATVERGRAIVERPNDVLALSTGASVAMAPGDGLAVDRDSTVRLHFRGGSNAIVCPQSSLVLDDARTRPGIPEGPEADLTLGRGAVVLATASSSAGFAALSARIAIAPGVVASEGPATFAVRARGVTVSSGTVRLNDVIVAPEPEVACPPGDGSAPSPTAPPTSPDVASPSSAPPPPSDAGSPGVPSSTPSASPSGTSSPSVGPSLTPVPSPGSTPPPTPGPTPPPTPAPTPPPTPAPTPPPTPAPDFGLSCTPSTLPDPMSSFTVVCTVSSSAGFSAPVTLSCAFVSPAPSFWSCDFMPQPVTPPAGGSASTTLQLSVGPPDCYPLDVVGVSGSLVHRTRLSCP